MNSDNVFNLTDKTTISEYIKYLQKMADGYGDLPIVTTLVHPLETYEIKDMSTSIGDDKLFIYFHIGE